MSTVEDERAREDEVLRAEFGVAARRQVDAREPLDGTECGVNETLGGRLFVCANPPGHDLPERGIKQCGHRFVHLVRDEDA